MATSMVYTLDIVVVLVVVVDIDVDKVVVGFAAEVNGLVKLGKVFV